MAQTMVNFRMDEDLKKKMEKVCADMGMSMTMQIVIPNGHLCHIIRPVRVILSGRPLTIIPRYS